MWSIHVKSHFSNVYASTCPQKRLCSHSGHRDLFGGIGDIVLLYPGSSYTYAGLLCGLRYVNNTYLDFIYERAKQLTPQRGNSPAFRAEILVCREPGDLIGGFGGESGRTEHSKFDLPLSCPFHG